MQLKAPDGLPSGPVGFARRADLRNRLPGIALLDDDRNLAQAAGNALFDLRARRPVPLAPDARQVDTRRDQVRRRHPLRGEQRNRRAAGRGGGAALGAAKRVCGWRRVSW